MVTERSTSMSNSEKRFAGWRTVTDCWYDRGDDSWILSGTGSSLMKVMGDEK